MTMRSILLTCAVWCAWANLSIGRAQDALEKLERETIAELPPPPATDPGTQPGIEGRPTLGISVDDVSDLLRRRFGITTEHGAVITRIHEGSPAAKAGLPLGGVVVSINGKRIGSANDIIAVIQAFRPGDEIEVTYFEGDRIGRKKIRLVPGAPIPPAGLVPRATPGGTAAPADPPLRLGRRKPGSRPLLDALERTLDVVLPPLTDPGTIPGAEGDAALTPPPPPPTATEGGVVPPAATDELPPPPPPPTMELNPPAPANDPGDPFPPTRARDRAVQPPPPPAPGKRPPVTEPPMKKDPQSVLVSPTDATDANAAVDAELTALRAELQALRDQMEQVQKKIDALEKKKRG